MLTVISADTFSDAFSFFFVLTFFWIFIFVHSFLFAWKLHTFLPCPQGSHKPLLLIRDPDRVTEEGLGG